MDIYVINAYLTDNKTPLYVSTLLPISVIAILTIITPDVVAYLIMLASIWPYYRLTSCIQERYFECSRTQAHLQIIMPFYILITTWAMLLVVTDRTSFLLGCVGPFTFVLLSVIWPVFRHNIERTKRHVPFYISYSMSAVFFIVAATVYIGRLL